MASHGPSPVAAPKFHLLQVTGAKSQPRRFMPRSGAPSGCIHHMTPIRECVLSMYMYYICIYIYIYAVYSVHSIVIYCMLYSSVFMWIYVSIICLQTINDYDDESNCQTRKNESWSSSWRNKTEVATPQKSVPAGIGHFTNTNQPV